LKNTADTDDNEEMHKLSKVEYFYSGGDGLTQSWLGGNTSTPISKVHEAHRDILARFTGVDETTPEGYSALNTDRANWKCRFWLNEPEDLQKVIETLQYEGGFIFTFNASGGMRYIHISTSYSSSDWSLGDTDLSNVQISHTPFSDLLTKWKIIYSKMPDGNGYFDSQDIATTTNSTSRTKWNIQTEENIKEVNLDMLVNNVTGDLNDDVNDGFIPYYGNMLLDVKTIVNCTIVNNTKGYLLETGDIIKFDPSSMDVKAFSNNWTKYFMVTKINRTLGRVSIECREVG